MDDAQSALTDMNLARGQREEKTIAGHDAAVDVYAIMKKRYRKDKSSLNAIELLPIQDEKPAATLSRMTATSNLWGKLPNPPGSATAFKAWDTMGKTEFDVLVTALKDAIEDEPEAEEEFARINGILKAMEEDIGDFVGAALVQGRNQYAEGTEERAAVDSIPTDDSSTPLPGAAVITDEGTSDPGRLFIEIESEHATRISVWRKGPTDPDFVQVADGIDGLSYEVFGLATGTHTVKAAGVNSTGTGPESDPMDLAVI